MKSVTSTVRIRMDQAQKINDLGLNLSDFVRKKLDEEFEKDLLVYKKYSLQKELEKVNESIKNKEKQDQALKKKRTEENLRRMELIERIRNRRRREKEAGKNIQYSISIEEEADSILRRK